MILNDINFTKKGKDPDNDLENSKDSCSCGAVGIFQGLVVLRGNLSDVQNLLRCAGLVLLLHFCEVSLLCNLSTKPSQCENIAPDGFEPDTTALFLMLVDNTIMSTTWWFF